MPTLHMPYQSVEFEVSSFNLLEIFQVTQN